MASSGPDRGPGRSRYQKLEPTSGAGAGRPEGPGPDSDEEETVGACHPCAEGDKSVFYSLHCDNPRVRCRYCGQKVCQYHFLPNTAGVVGGHSNCDAPPEASQRISGRDEAPLADSENTARRSRALPALSGVACTFFAVLLGGVVFLWLRSRRAEHSEAEHEAEDAGSDLALKWTVGAILWALLLGFAACCCGGTAAGFCIVTSVQLVRKRAWPLFYPRELLQGSAEVMGAQLGRLLASEVLLGNVTTIAAFCLSLIFSRAGRAPVWLLLPSIPLLVRAKVIEYKLLPFYGGPLRPLKEGLDFVLSAFEVSDKFLDGVTLPVMYYVDDHIHSRWIDSFQASHAQFIRALAPVANWCHLWRFAAISLFVSLGQQQLVGSDTKGLHNLPTFGADGLAQPGFGPEAVQVAVAADVAAFGALGGRFARKAAADGRAGMVESVMGLIKSFVENMPQGMASVELMNLVGMPPLDRPLVFLSAVTSIASLAKQGAKMTVGAVRITRRVCAEDTASAVPIFFVFVPAGLLTMAVAAFLAVKLVMIQICPTHSWGPSTGCVELG